MDKSNLLQCHYTDSESADSDTDGASSVPERRFINFSDNKPSLILKPDGEEGAEDLGESSSSSSSDFASDNPVIKDNAESSLPLVNPFVKAGLKPNEDSESVFSVPIRESGDQESSVLERHVKLTPSHKTQLKINGKKICWKYRKGTCRFGSKCIFAHDSDIVLDNETSKGTKTEASNENTPDAKRIRK